MICVTIFDSVQLLVGVKKLVSDDSIRILSTSLLIPIITTPHDSSPPSTMTLTPLDHLHTHGYVIFPSLFNPTQVSSLRNASLHLTILARAGRWPYIRTLPKQFPPWPSDPSQGIWGVQHLLHPEVPSSLRASFAAAYFGPELAAAIRPLLAATDEELVMELFNLLVTPDADFKLRWHRDVVPFDDHESAALARRKPGPMLYAQYNVALWDDASLEVIPGSHVRARTDSERDALEGDAHAELEGAVKVKLKPGDVVFYDNNLIHRGVYSKNVKRLTLHGSVSHVRAGNSRASNVLQHGVGAWVGKCGFDELEGDVRKRAESMRRQLITLGNEAGEVEYVHDD